MPNFEKITEIERKLNTIDKKQLQSFKQSYKIQETKATKLSDENKTLKMEVKNIEKEKVNLQKLLEKQEIQLRQFEELKRIKPLYQNDFNNFIASSVKALQNNLESDDDSDYEFMIRDVQIEALVSTENRNGKLSYVIPTSTQLKEIDGNKLQRLKYSLSVVPKSR
ncbi:hypothetical protein [Arcobacter arenosus]|uniref:Uncharacterized protein n=1 Tax=Arcobacter arenosus TaxID=2576037 RepID=A0A5R8Y0P4_9BACT|nr:hypothetical protein [Arcobacter arenosus]TLP38431.1 hypothetical protein FDK22_08145 [Arcobacter arenosus]